MHMAPPDLLEGNITGSTPLPVFIPHDARLNAEVTALHHIARKGLIPLDAAERQINTYLAAASPRAAWDLALPKRWLVMSLADAPHHSLLPDLGNLTHRILARAPIPCALSTALEQCLPAIRHPVRPNAFADSHDVLLNLVMAFLLGLYPGGTVKRPDFRLRVLLFAQVHKIMTSDPRIQGFFCNNNQPLLTMACMEYVARILPAFMPAQAAFLNAWDQNSSAVFFRRVPALCDEFRQSLIRDVPTLSWPELRRACLGMTDKVARLKKAAAPAVPRSHGLQTRNRHRAPISAHWDAPRLERPETLSEYTLLADALALSDVVLLGVQRDIQVYPLPGNLRRMQVESLMAHAEPRSAYLRSRLTLCMHCTLTNKHPDQTRLRLDTLRQTLLCCHCGHDNLVSVDMLGRILRHKQRFLVLCPGCTSIRPFHGEQIWLQDQPCPHGQQSQEVLAQPKTRKVCRVCSEPVAQPPLQRVDHLTGEIVDFYFCQKHGFGKETMRWYTNARQMAAYCD